MRYARGKFSKVILSSNAELSTVMATFLCTGGGGGAHQKSHLQPVLRIRIRAFFAEYEFEICIPDLDSDSDFFQIRIRIRFWIQ
jgi:hypothetical protein